MARTGRARAADATRSRAGARDAERIDILRKMIDGQTGE